ncbi:MAG: hypothetical protein KUF79_17215 [Candidatus Thiodiazotropha sp. (ex Ctena orbiculata)]|nr:hypothetical protein [Candidatus Thiodiazotropha taylori]
MEITDTVIGALALIAGLMVFVLYTTWAPKNNQRKSSTLLPCGFQPMSSAPRNGTEIEILFQHLNFYYADENSRDEWHQVCKAYWTNHNHGGWVWHGLAGTPICWRPISHQEGKD